MSATEGKSLRARLGTAAMWLSLTVLLYAFSTGPVTRWFPKAADVLYQPLSPVARSKLLGPVLVRWVKLWGAKVD